MTVSAQTPINRSTGNGVTTVFAYTFKILNKADILVTVDGVAKTVDVDYTVSGVGAEGGGNVTFSVAPANLTSVVRRRNMQLTRATDYQDQGELPAATLDDDLDRAILMIQQVDEEVGRSLVLPAGVAGVSAELPAPVGGSFLGWNPAGDAIQNYAGLASTPVSLAMAPVVAAATLSAARTALGTPEAAQKLTDTLATVGGTGTAITATQAPATSGVKVVDLIVTTGNGGAATTLAVNGDAAKSVKAYDIDGNKVDTILVAGQVCRFVDDGTYWILQNKLPQYTRQYTSTDQTITSGGPLTLAHGLGAEPFLVSAELICQSAEANYAAGHVVPLGTAPFVLDGVSGSNGGMAVRKTSTDIIVRFGSAATVFALNDWNTGAGTNLTNSKWKIRFKAWL